MTTLSEILAKLENDTFARSTHREGVIEDIKWLLDENARLRGQRDALRDALEALCESTREIHVNFTSPLTSHEHCDWCRAQAALAAAKDDQ